MSIPEREAHYLSHVLRLRPGAQVVVFNGRGAERLASVEILSRRHAELRLDDTLVPLAEPEIEVHLVQALLKNDAMDLVVQKATELGVRAIHAVKTELSVVKLDRSKAARRAEHWERIGQGACEQSGRHRPPTIETHDSLDACLAALPATGPRLVFHTDAAIGAAAPGRAEGAITLLVGPEGGLSPADLERIDADGFVRRSLGPRVLRAETAAIAACTLAQLCWGGTS